jgi:hypothetical protein
MWPYATDTYLSTAPGISSSLSQTLSVLGLRSQHRTASTRKRSREEPGVDAW